LGIHCRLLTIGINDLEICRSGQRQSELGREYLQIAHRRRVVESIDDGNRVRAPLGIGGCGIGTAPGYLRRHELINASERRRRLVGVSCIGWAPLPPRGANILRFVWARRPICSGSSWLDSGITTSPPRGATWPYAPLAANPARPSAPASGRIFTNKCRGVIVRPCPKFQALVRLGPARLSPRLLLSTVRSDYALERLKAWLSDPDLRQDPNPLSSSVPRPNWRGGTVGRLCTTPVSDSASTRPRGGRWLGSCS
jgi:hypothetical protein